MPTRSEPDNAQILAPLCPPPPPCHPRSFGLILVTLLTQQVLRTRADWLLPRVPLGCPEEVTALVELCLASDPLARPSAAQVLAQLRAAPHAVRTEYTATHFNQSDNDDSYSQ